MKQMENARSGNNGKLWQSYFNRFKEHICSFEDQKVCCCGTQQIAPDELGLPDTTTIEKVPSTTEGKYQYTANILTILSTAFGSVTFPTVIWLCT